VCRRKLARFRIGATSSIFYCICRNRENRYFFPVSGPRQSPVSELGIAGAQRRLDGLGDDGIEGMRPGRGGLAIGRDGRGGLAIGFIGRGGLADGGGRLPGGRLL
jgi:hypothetical protein